MAPLLLIKLVACWHQATVVVSCRQTLLSDLELKKMATKNKLSKVTFPPKAGNNGTIRSQDQKDAIWII